MSVSVPIWNQAIGIYSVTLAVLGSLGNIIVFITCLRKSLRKVPTFVFLAFLSLIDMSSLYFYNLNDYFTAFYNLTIADFGLMACKFTSFFAMFVQIL